MYPSDYNELLAYATIDELPKTSRISVIIHYCSQSRCSTSIIPAEVENTEYLRRFETVTKVKNNCYLYHYGYVEPTERITKIYEKVLKEAHLFGAGGGI